MQQADFSPHKKANTYLNNYHKQFLHSAQCINFDLNWNKFLLEQE